MYDHDLANVYDALYQAGGKDYATEAAAITALIRQRQPGADSLLDAGCGTGLHLAGFAELFSQVEGADLSAAMCAIARRRVPDHVVVHEADMRTLSLGRRFSAVTCLFSSIGYLETETELNQTLHVFADHVEPGGVVLVEPWFTREQWADGKVACQTAQADGLQLVRMSYATTPDPEHSLMQMSYLCGADGEGVRFWTDEHWMSLFTTAQYEQAFTIAGLSDLEWIPGPRPGSRDRLIGTRPHGSDS